MNFVVESYENNREEDRLTINNAKKIEFITTIRTFNENFPPDAKILDCGAGTGIYSFYYAEKGYDVAALDITPRHIQIINEKLKDKTYNMRAFVADATDLSMFDNDTFDIVLCMGPIYHLIEKSMREKCLSECIRVLKPGGLLAVSYINRFYAFPYVALGDRKYLNMALAKTLIETGVIKHDDPNCFWTDSYYSIPEEVENDLLMLDLEIVDHLATNGFTPFLKDKIDCMNEEEF